MKKIIAIVALAASLSSNAFFNNYNNGYGYNPYYYGNPYYNAPAANAYTPPKTVAKPAAAK